MDKVINAFWSIPRDTVSRWNKIHWQKNNIQTTTKSSNACLAFPSEPIAHDTKPTGLYWRFDYNLVMSLQSWKSTPQYPNVLILHVMHARTSSSATTSFKHHRTNEFYRSLCECLHVSVFLSLSGMQAAVLMRRLQAKAICVRLNACVCMVADTSAFELRSGVGSCH